MTTHRYILVAAVLLLAAIIVPRAAAQNGMTSQNGPNFNCASNDGKRHYCNVDTRYGVTLVKQNSGSPCIQGQTWGYDRAGTWVDRGCRASFVLGNGYRPPPGNGYNPPPGNGYPGGGYPGGGYPPGGGYRPPPPQQGGTITCSSNNMGYNFCSAFTGRGVRLVNQRSGSPCIQGQTWGYNNKGVWVDRGCRADFLLSR
jgi:hypothetical protein